MGACVFCRRNDDETRKPKCGKPKLQDLIIGSCVPGARKVARWAVRRPHCCVKTLRGPHLIQSGAPLSEALWARQAPAKARCRSINLIRSCCSSPASSSSPSLSLSPDPALPPERPFLQNLQEGGRVPQKRTTWPPKKKRKRAKNNADTPIDLPPPTPKQPRPWVVRASTIENQDSKLRTRRAPRGNTSRRDTTQRPSHRGRNVIPTVLPDHHPPESSRRDRS